MNSKTNNFRDRLQAREAMIGTFLKTPSPVVAEVLALSELDIVAIDAEHAPFGRVEADLCIAALRAAAMPALVRVADDSSTQIRNALDSGATGVIIPHVTSADQARRVVAACHFGDAGRGYAGSPRAAGYGTRPMTDYLAESGKQTTVVVQIEDLSALDEVEDIARVNGVDCLFIGRADLAVAMQKSPMDETVIKTVEDICARCIAAGSAVGMFTPDLDELPKWRDLGATLFLLSSDHAFLLGGANQLAASIR